MDEIKKLNVLPIQKIFLESLRLPISHFPSLLRTGLPLLVLLVIALIVGQFISGDEGVGKSGYFIPLTLIFAISVLGSSVMAVVGCHRVFLMDKKDVASTEPFRWSGRETRFLGWWIAIGFSATLVFLPFKVIIIPLISLSLGTFLESRYLLRLVMLIVFLPVYYFFSRWSLLLPATAVDERPEFSWAWDLSSGNGLRLSLLVGVIPLLTNLGFEFLPEYDSFLYSLLIGAAWLFIAVVEISLLSLSYKWLVDNSSQNKLPAGISA